MRIWGFRVRPIAIIAAGAGLITISGLSVFGAYSTSRTNDFLLQSKDAEVAFQSARSQKLANELQSTQKELDAQKQALDKATSDLNNKLAELDAAQKKIQAQQAQISANSSELQKLRNRPPLFSFKVDTQSLTNADQKKADVQQVVSDAYDTISSIYGQPYLLHAVVIDFVSSFSNPNAAAETEISNGPDGLSVTIRLKDFDKNSFSDVNGVIHEMIHTFHGLANLEPVAYEEGETVAAADVVMQKLIDAGKIPSFNPLYIRISDATYRSSSLTLLSDDNAFYSAPDVAGFYQLAGYGWYQMYKANNDFFKTFNEKIYAQKRNGTEITGRIVKDDIKESVASVDGQSVDSWLTTKAFALK